MICTFHFRSNSSDWGSIVDLVFLEQGVSVDEYGITVGILDFIVADSRGWLIRL